MDGNFGNPGRFSEFPSVSATLFATRDGVCSSWFDEVRISDLRRLDTAGCGLVESDMED
jgi:hypothetical protein